MPLDLLAGALLFLAGIIFDRLMPARRKTPRPPKPVEPICGCSHHHSFHDPATGQCHGTRKSAETVVRDATGAPVLDRWGDVQTVGKRAPCTCRVYSGPVPLAEYTVPQIAASE